MQCDMQTLITNDIKVSVEVFYRPVESRPDAERFVFSYRITIENLGSDTVQLLRRRWYITDSVGDPREVEGLGVVGQTPILRPGASHSYGSWCPLTSSIGKMSGYFTMINIRTRQNFAVQVPEFKMIADFKLN